MQTCWLWSVGYKSLQSNPRTKAGLICFRSSSVNKSTKAPCTTCYCCTLDVPNRSSGYLIWQARNEQDPAYPCYTPAYWLAAAPFQRRWPIYVLKFQTFFLLLQRTFNSSNFHPFSLHASTRLSTHFNFRRLDVGRCHNKDGLTTQDTCMMCNLCRALPITDSQGSAEHVPWFLEWDQVTSTNKVVAR